MFECRDNYLVSLDCSGNPVLISLICSPMPTFEMLYLNTDQKIRYISYDCNAGYIPEQTIIEIL